jgi:hypothetical protein
MSDNHGLLSRFSVTAGNPPGYTVTRGLALHNPENAQTTLCRNKLQNITLFGSQKPKPSNTKSSLN